MILFYIHACLKNCFYIFATEKEVSDSKLKNNMHCAIKFCYYLGKMAPENVKLMKEAYKDFGESMIFRWHSDFKTECLSAELAPRPG